jgi:hypothetical protein
VIVILVYTEFAVVTVPKWCFEGIAKHCFWCDPCGWSCEFGLISHLPGAEIVKRY